MNLIDVLLAILIIVVIVFVLYLIKLVKRIFITIEIVETEMKELDEKMTPLLEEFQELAESGNILANFAKEQAEFADSFLGSLKNKFGFLIKKESEQSSPEEKANNLVTNLKGIFKGATTFINEIKK
jgi:predicted PurR-regulated permease PerM